MKPSLVDKKLRMLYNHLDQKFNISDESRNSLPQLTRNRSRYGASAYRDFSFNYNNRVKHAIEDHHQLSKLYLKEGNFMREDNTITIDTFDSSAILNILERAKMYGRFVAHDRVPQLAEFLRINLRNKWAHCGDLNKWTQDKFWESFDLMIQIVAFLENDPTMDHFYKAKVGNICFFSPLVLSNERFLSFLSLYTF